MCDESGSEEGFLMLRVRKSKACWIMQSKVHHRGHEELSIHP